VIDSAWLRGEWLRIAILLAAALLFGLLTGLWGYAGFGALAIWLTVHGREFVRFARWAVHPLSRPDNRTDAWQVPTARLYRAIRGSRSRSARLIAELRSLTALAEALPDAAVVVRTSGEIEAYNVAAQALLGLTTRDRGNNLVSLLRHPAVTALLSSRGGSDLVELVLPRYPSRNLEMRRIEIDSRRYLVLVRDITQLNRLLSMRQDFVANVSHELRTPLTVILGYLEAMEDPQLDADERRALVDRMRAPANRMKALVDDLLLLTRLESSPTPALDDLAPIDVGALITDIVTDAKQLSGGRHKFNLDIDRTLLIRGLRSELYSAFANLITNAVRYSPDGGAIDITWQPGDGGTAHFSVRDHGVGIAAEHISRITERFYRVDLASSRVRGGTGLGLAITKHVLKRHDSTLEVESRLGSGSRFSCNFPARLTITRSEHKELA